MSKIPTGWATTPMKTLGTIGSGGTPKRTESAFFGGFIPWVTISDLNNAYVSSTQTNISQLGLENSSAKLLPPQTLLVALYGSIGKLGITSTHMATNQAIAWIKPDGKLTDEKYLFYFIEANREKLRQAGMGITQKNIYLSDIQDFSVKLPPQNEQKRIIEKLEELLSQLDAGASELKAAQQKLERYRQSLLKAAVEGRLTAKWREKNRPTESGEQLLNRILRERRQRWESQQLAKFEAQGKKPPKDWQKKYPEPVKPDTSDLPELPEGWVWASLDMLGEVVSGIAKGSKTSRPAPKRSVPYLRVANVQRGYLDLNEIKLIEATEKDIHDLTLKNGDVLFNEGGDRDKLGRGWVWKDEIPNCIHQNHVFRFRGFSSDMEPELISHHGNTFGKLWFQNAGKQTTNLASINMTMLKSFPVPVSSTEEQKEILEIIQRFLDSTFRQDATLRKTALILDSQRQNILQAAFAGELVPQDPNDEPASELLARIQAERAAQGPRKGGKAKWQAGTEAKPRKPRARRPKEDT